MFRTPKFIRSTPATSHWKKMLRKSHKSSGRFWQRTFIERSDVGNEQAARRKSDTRCLLAFRSRCMRVAQFKASKSSLKAHSRKGIKQMKRLEGKVAVVTGGNSGIGL